MKIPNYYMVIIIFRGRNKRFVNGTIKNLTVHVILFYKVHLGNNNIHIHT